MRVVDRWTPIGVIVLLGVYGTADVAAWSETGHQIVCDIAFQELRPPARDAVQRLL